MTSPAITAVYYAPSGAPLDRSLGIMRSIAFPIVGTSPLANDPIANRPIPPAVNNDLPDSSIAGNRSLARVVADEIARVTSLPEPDGVAAILSQPSIDADDQGDKSDGKSFSDEVISAHQERIKILVQRVAELRRLGASNSAIASLNVRLRRAQAARDLAIARVQDRPGTVRSVEVGFRCRPIAMSRSCGGVSQSDRFLREKKLEITAIGSSPRYAADPMRALTRLHDLTSTQHRIYVLNAGDGSIFGHRVISGEQVARVRHAADQSARLVAVSFRGHHHHYRAERHVAQRLNYARRSLAAARQALLGEKEPRIAFTRRPPIKIVGLWRWDGSDTWSLPSSKNTRARHA